ncbi:unnamed protein product [Trichobilharzia regenti]|nr:unnamed protein product [Trichobilharzia regenti]
MILGVYMSVDQVSYGTLPNKPNRFTVDKQDPSYISVSLSVEVGSNVDIECQDNANGTSALNSLHLRVNDIIVLGSPFDVNVKAKVNNETSLMCMNHMQKVNIRSLLNVMVKRYRV